MRKSAQKLAEFQPNRNVVWQITPTVLNKMLKSDDKQKTERVTKAFLKMKKFDIAALERAFEGR